MALRANFLAVADFGDSQVDYNADGTAVFKEGCQIGMPMLGLKDRSLAVKAGRIDI